jgi:hypothetical protein
MKHICMVFLLLLGSLALAQAPKVLAAFNLHEDFGVSHPEQIVYFGPGPKLDPAKVSLHDAQGKAVPFQVMRDGRIAVRTDLPAGMTKNWKLVASKAASDTPGIVVVAGADGYEIVNEKVGIRIPKVATDLAKTPSPIQGLRFQDGTWTAVGPNYMTRPAKKMTVEFLEQGPLVIKVKVAYIYDKGLLHSSGRDLPDVPAGEGAYSTTIEVQAGQPSILFEEECETDISYKVDITNGLTPDRGQYRGHHANTTDEGIDPDGSVYKYGANVRHDALVHLKYEGKGKDRWSQTTYPYMSHWDPWGVSTGFYWQLYDSRLNGSDNMLGIFAGPASRLISPGLTGVSFDTNMVNGQPRAALQVRFQRLMPTQYYTTHMRFGWGIYLGQKSADVKPQMEVQGINKQMNVHSGMNLNTLAKLPVDFPDPKEGYGTLYAPITAWKKVAEALREEKSKGGRALYTLQYNANPYFVDLLQYWASPTPESAKKAADVVNGFAKAYLDTQVNGEGIYQHSTHYFMGASGMSSFIIWIDQLLASDQLAAEEKAKLKRSAALFATALWDNDVAPMQDNTGMNWGPANMSSMWRGTRYTYTLFLSTHPSFSKEVEAVRKDAISLLYDYTNAAGACSASAHYTGASMVPILNLMQQMQMRGVVDAFATEKRLTDYAEWEMQLLTPPEVRFGGLRKIVAVGDGSTEQNVRIGQIGTGFAKSNPELSARLMGAWKAMGSPQDNFYGASLLKIDAGLPAVSPKLGSAQFDGWMSVLRHGWDTKDETSIHFVNGDFLTDHRHNDQGEVVIYALGAPLSLDPGCMYYPRPSSAYLHSMALPESILGYAWDADRVPLDKPGEGYSIWIGQSSYTPLQAFTESSSASTTFARGKNKAMTWQRTVRNLHPDPAHPVIVIDDVFGGKDLAHKPVVSTLMLMAQGEVTTPVGKQTPVERTHSADQLTTPEKLPYTGPAFPLAEGLNKFAFTGQWGIDWELYVDAPAPMQASIGNWINKWHPSTEQGQFQRAQGKPFEERQHILRVRGQDATRFIILPYRKGEQPEAFQVEKLETGTRIRSGEMTLLLGAHGYACSRGTRQSVTTFDIEPVDELGIYLTGGPAELILDEQTGTLTLSGTAGERKVRLPQGWKPTANPAVSKAGEDWLVKYNGGKPLTVKVEIAR